MVNTSRIVQTYDTLKENILNGAFRPRTRLRIEHLSEKFDVGPGAIREALSRLTSEGMVVAEPQRGFLVAPISKSDLRDLTAVRIEIEVKCLRNSIELGSVQWETQVLAANHLLSRTPEYADNGDSHPNWAVVHTNFHDALVAACGSPWRLKLRGQLFLQAERYRRLSVPHARFERDVASEHRALAEATLRRDAEAAIRLLEEHFQKTADLLLASDAPFDDGDI